MNSTKMAETPQAGPCSDCTRQSLELKECRRCLTEVCPECRPAHKIPRKCKILETRRKLRLHTPQPEEMKRRLREKGKEWRGAKNDMDAKMRDVESQQALLLQQVKVTMTECKRAALFMDDRVDIIGEGEVKDLSGWIRTSLEHIQDGNEGMLDQVEHVSNSLLDTMINLQDRLAEDPEQQLGVVQKRMDQLDQCIRFLQGSGEDQDQVPTRGQGTRDADTQTETRGQGDFTQTETRGQENFTQTDRQEQEDLAQPELHGEVDQRGRQVGDGRIGARLLPWGLVVFLLVLLAALAVPIFFQMAPSSYPAPTSSVGEIRADPDKAWTTETDEASLESSDPDKLGKRSEKSDFESEIETKLSDKHDEAHGLKSDRSNELDQESMPETERTGIHVGVDTNTPKTEVANKESITETEQTDSHSFLHTHKDQTGANGDDSILPPTTTHGLSGWLNLCSGVMILVLSLPTVTLLIRRCWNTTQDMYTQTYTERRHVDIQTETDTLNDDTQTYIELHNQLTETVLVLRANVSTQTPSDYRNVRVSVIDVTELVVGIAKIHDTATCPVTGRVYVCGLREGDDDREAILVFDRDMTFITHVTTDIHTDYYFPYISVSPAGELLVTAYISNQISFLDRAGRLVRRVETGSRCGRCVSDGNRLYVCHPGRGCVTGLDDQGQQIRQIGGGELRVPMFLTIHESHLYVSDVRTRSLHVYSTSGDPVRRISAAGHVTEIEPCGVHVDGAGHVLLADRKNKCIHVYGKDGSWIHTLTDDRIRDPQGLTQTAEGGLVLANLHPPALFIFNPNC